MSHTKINGSTRSLYYQFYGLARMYWRDMQSSGLDTIEKSKRRAYEVAAQRVGFPLSLCDRLYATCFDERLVPNGRMLEMSDHISTCVDLTYKPPMYQPTMRDRPFVLVDPFDEEEVTASCLS